MAKKIVASEAQKLKSWLFRHHRNDLYTRWRAARGTGKAPFLAFTAIATDEQLLVRLRRMESITTILVRDAEVQISRASDLERVDPGAGAAAGIVTERIEAWRRRPIAQSWDDEERRPEPPAEETAPYESTASQEPNNALGMARDALRDFPQVRLSAARFLFETARRLGTAGLLDLGPPMDIVFALGAVRIAARSERGQLSGGALPHAHCLDVIQIVQNWGYQTGINPMVVGGYQGRFGTVIDRIISLAVDAQTCADLAARLPGGPSALGFEQWEIAEEVHSYVLIAYKDNRLEEMEHDMAIIFSSAAARLAARAMTDPMVAPPTLPQGWVNFPPQSVLAFARSICGDDIQPRRSGLAGAPVNAV